MRERRDKVILCSLALATFVVGVVGMGWGLPSQGARKVTTPGSGLRN